MPNLKMKLLKVMMAAGLASCFGAIISIISLTPQALQRWEILNESLPPISQSMLFALPMPFLPVIITPLVFWIIFKTQVQWKWEVQLFIASSGFLFSIGALTIWGILKVETDMLATGLTYPMITWICNFVYVALFVICLFASGKSVSRQLHD